MKLQSEERTVRSPPNLREEKILEAYSNQIEILKALKHSNSIAPHDMISTLKKEIKNIQTNSESLKNQMQTKDQ